MRLIKFSICSLIFFLLSLYTFAQNLSEDSSISLLTASPMGGEQLVSSFGHTALRVTDPGLDIDYIFNYGMFDESLSTLSTLAGVFRGDLQCEMWVAPFKDYLDATRKENRTLIEYSFNLSQEEKNLIWKGLINNAKEENRKYIFDFFFKNCTTFPRDLITDNIGEKIVLPDYLGKKTYRQINAHYAEYNPWFNFVVDLISGLNMDKIAPDYESLYIPQELEKAWLLSYIENNNGDRKPLISTSNLLIDGSDREVVNNKMYFSPLLCALILLIIVGILSFLEWRKKTYYKWLDCILFGFTGLLGIVFYIFKIGYAHWYSAPDWMILWIHPMHLVAVLLMIIKPYSRSVYIYHVINLLLLSFLVSGIFFLPQHYNSAYIPFMSCLWVRSFSAIFRKRRN